jgi:uncharacterized C2H2 Zn-finger protein
MSETAVTFLTLGDGDFSYSLDLARYLASSIHYSSTNRALIASGIDSFEQVLEKYKDSPFLLKQLQSTTSTSTKSFLSISIQHGINAILDKESPMKADHVLFNHPHVGTEDAALHARFLCHMLYSATHYWMKPNGIFHLALVKGQYERWQCEDAAKRSGLLLLERNDFRPPPVPQPTYQYRRHQTGKSFESRRARGGSEMFTFGRQSEQPIAKCLPWQHDAQLACTADVPVQAIEEHVLACPHCDKTFREERSRKCHIRDKHAEAPDKKPKIEASPEGQVQCEHCRLENGDPRTFVNAKALEDHIRAKHAGIHKKKILPDWHKEKEQQSDAGKDDAPWSSKPESTIDDRIDENGQFGSCDICGLAYQDDEHHQARHQNDFVPFEGTASFHCSLCSKTFRERRAKLQHENFCSSQFTAK